jgi:Flp pilus assembly protein TadG
MSIAASIQTWLKTGPATLGALKRCRSGVSTVEFAMLSPVFILILAATVDFGLVLHKRLQLNSAVSAATNYTLLQGSELDSTNAQELANKTAAVLVGSGSGTWNTTVLVNNAVKLTVKDGTATSTSGGGSADLCYCPERTGAAITWGAAVTCGDVCPSGGIAGKFVHITLASTHEPIFSGFGLVDSGAVVVETMLQAQ